MVALSGTCTLSIGVWHVGMPLKGRATEDIHVWVETVGSQSRTREDAVRNRNGGGGFSGLKAGRMLG